MKKRMLLFIVSAVIISVFTALSASAQPAGPAPENENGIITYEVVCRKGYDSVYVSSGLESYVDIDKFSAYLHTEIMKSSSSISLTAYPDGEAINIPYNTDTNEALKKLIFTDFFDLFNVSSFRFSVSSVSLTSKYFKTLIPIYDYTKEEFDSMYAQCEYAAEELLTGIAGNDSLSDLEKALLIHDRIAIYCQYDTALFTTGVEDISHSMYGMLVNRVSVCQGYARAYCFLLKKVGIESCLVTSDTLNHEWNMVVIDGVKYIVDVTHDDPLNYNSTWDIKGHVDHTFFLCSAEKYSAKHNNATDFDMSATDTRYDDAFWNGVEASFVLAGGNVYYLVKDTGEIVNFRTGETVFTVDDEHTSFIETTWYTYYTPGYGGSYYPGVYSSLATDGAKLYFNTRSGIWKLDLYTGIAEMIVVTENDAANFKNLFGFVKEPRGFTYDYSRNPSFSVDNGRAFAEYIFERFISSIEIVSTGRTEYDYGEAFDYAGVVINAYYSDGTVETVGDGFSMTSDELTPGTHTVTVEYQGCTAEFEIHINKQQQTETVSLSIESVSGTSVTFVEVTGAEYSMDGINWQDSNVFDGLTPATWYSFYARLKETDTYYAGQYGEPILVETMKGDNAACPVPEAERVTGDSITLVIIPGAEYSLDGWTWQDGPSFGGLMPATGYSVYARYKETEALNAGEASMNTVYTAKGIQTMTVLPTVESVTDTTITLANDPSLEYSLDASTWQESNVFTGLLPSTGYTVYARYRETETTEAGMAGDALTVYTDRATLEISIVISGGNKAGDMLTATVAGIPDGELPLIMWYSDGESCGEIGNKYYIQTSDEGKTITAVVTVDSNSYSGSAESNGIRIPVPGETVWGDANNDGKVTSSDIVRLKKYFAEYDPDTGLSTVSIGPGADSNGDGKITSSDIVRLKKYFAEYDPDTGSSTIHLGPADPATYVTVRTEKYSVNSVIPYETQTVNSQKIPRGTTQTVTQGKNGTLKTDYVRTYENGVLVSDEKESETVVESPVNEVVHLGIGGTFTTSDGLTYSFNYYMDVTATVYSYAEGFTGKTATGQQVRQGIIAVDPKVIPYHTKCYATCSYLDYGVCYAEDCGAFSGNHIDLYFDETYTLQDMYNFGRRNMILYILDY